MRRRFVVLAAAAVVLAGCGEEERRPSPPAVAISAREVLGMDVNPADGALHLATDGGIVRLDGRRAARVPGRLGGVELGPDATFAFVGPDHLLGSGHPAVDGGAPEDLGLMESRDGGRTWRSVALLGEADLHALRPRARSLIAYDLANDRLVRTRNGGATFTRLESPGLIADLAQDPARADRLVAVSAVGLLRSDDGGRRWRPLALDARVVAWPAPDRLYLVDATGAVRLSDDGGGTARVVGRLPAEPRALLARDAGTLQAITTELELVRSDDGGATWRTELRLVPR